MGILRKFEGGVESAMDRAAGTVFRAPIEPAQIAKRAEKQMHREKLVGAGRQYAPTLYNVLVNPADDRKLFGFYPTMAAEIETFLMAKGEAAGLTFDGRPLVRFIVDEKLKSGKFDIIAENVAAPIIKQLRVEEMEYYGISVDNPARPAPEPVPPAGSHTRTPRQARAPRHDGDYPMDDGPDTAGLDRYGNSPDYPDDLDDFDDSGVLAPQGAYAVGARPAAMNLPVVAGPSDAPATIPVGGRTPLHSPSLVNIRTGKSYGLDQSPMVIGRDETNSIVVNDANASRSHAQLMRDATGAWKLVDLGSTNGTLLNERPCERALLRDGDLITIGMTVFEFME